MSGRFVNRLTLLLLLVCVALGGEIAWQWRAAEVRAAMPAERMPDADGTPGSAAMPASLPSTALQEYKDILDRPLFIEGRRPPDTPAPSVVARKKAPPLQLVLEGVAISVDKRVALVRDVSSNELLSLAEGSTQADWTISSVLADRVVVSRNGQTQELLLEPPATRPATIPARRVIRRKQFKP